MEYINVYNNNEAYEEAKQTPGFPIPHVSLIDNTMEVKYDPYPEPEEEEENNEEQESI